MLRQISNIFMSIQSKKYGNIDFNVTIEMSVDRKTLHYGATSLCAFSICAHSHSGSYRCIRQCSSEPFYGTVIYAEILLVVEEIHGYLQGLISLFLIAHLQNRYYNFLAVCFFAGTRKEVWMAAQMQISALYKYQGWRFTSLWFFRC